MTTHRPNFPSQLMKRPPLRLFVVGALIYGGGFPWSNSIESSTSWSGGGWFISAQGGLRQPCATLDIAYENNYKKESSGNDLVVSSNHWMICFKFLSACHTFFAAKKQGKAPEIHCCSQAWTLWQRQSTRVQWQMPKGKGHGHSHPWPPIRDRWGLGFFPRIFPQQVFNLESIVGIWYESQCFFEQFGRSKDFSHQKTLFETTCSVPQWLWKSTPGHRVELSNPQSCGRVV